jgi:hypothetical protein
MGALSIESLLGHCALLLLRVQRLLILLAPCTLCWFAWHGGSGIRNYPMCRQVGSEADAGAEVIVD